MTTFLWLFIGAALWHILGQQSEEVLTPKQEEKLKSIEEEAAALQEELDMLKQNLSELEDQVQEYRDETDIDDVILHDELLGRGDSAL